MLFLFVLIKLRHCWYNLALVRILSWLQPIAVKPMLNLVCYDSLFFELYCTCRLLRFVNDCNKEHYYNYYYYIDTLHMMVKQTVITLVTKLDHNLSISDDISVAGIPFSRA